MIFLGFPERSNTMRLSKSAMLPDLLQKKTIAGCGDPNVTDLALRLIQNFPGGYSIQNRSFDPVKHGKSLSVRSPAGIPDLLHELSRSTSSQGHPPERPASN